MTEEIQGIVKKTIFSSKDGRFCVFRVFVGLAPIVAWCAVLCV